MIFVFLFGEKHLYCIFLKEGDVEVSPHAPELVSLSAESGDRENSTLTHFRQLWALGPLSWRCLYFYIAVGQGLEAGNNILSLIPLGLFCLSVLQWHVIFFFKLCPLVLLSFFKKKLKFSVHFKNQRYLFGCEPLELDVGASPRQRLFLSLFYKWGKYALKSQEEDLGIELDLFVLRSVTHNPLQQIFLTTHIHTCAGWLK